MSRITKIVIIGPESTGKSTLSQALAQALDTVWVPEYARTYIGQLTRPYNETDLAIIAAGQIGTEDAMLQKANNYLICDTDLQVIKVWSEHAFGRCYDAIMQAIAKRQYDMYLLTGIDMPWTHDPQREHPAPEMRQYFYNLYKDIVVNSGLPHAFINGTEEQRLEAALAAIKKLPA
jgi:NadR type nicotinamide-nucleotide adenylyltransferase